MTQDLQAALGRISGPHTAELAGREFAALVAGGIDDLARQQADQLGVDLPAEGRSR